MVIQDHTEALGKKHEADTLIDQGILGQLLYDVGEENAAAILDAFVQELRVQTGILQTAADNRDLDAIGRAAHRLKSSTASIGAMQLSRVVTLIEQAAREGQGDIVESMMDEFLDLANRSQDEMDAM
jgi:HPt (histidine-containing phosphotransfer) domain-containing protein